MRAIPSESTVLCWKTYFVTVGTVLSRRTALMRQKNGSIRNVASIGPSDSSGSVAMN
jgi:hypothetical protein